MGKSLILVLMLTFPLFILNCGPNLSDRAIDTAFNTPSSENGRSPNGAPERGGDNQGGNAGKVPSHNGSSSLGICSKLNFDGVNFPSQVTTSEIDAFELALNISGGLEGSTGWGNLANNFDGQGMSFGLLNQNFGQGSLQPIWIKMRDRHLGTLKSIFKGNHAASVLQMLNRWETSLSILEVNPGILSPLDIQNDFFTTASAVLGRNSGSVSWAVSNLYNGGQFKADWLQELTELANSLEYVTLQLESAAALHLRAKSYVGTLQVSQIRSYLFSFDIVVQNGGFYPGDLSDYKNFLSSSPHASDTQRLDQMLNFRLRHVNGRYVADVRSRKLAVIDGHGFVHGAARNFETEYCFDRLNPFN